MSARKPSGAVMVPAIGPMFGKVEAVSLAALIMWEIEQARDMPDYVRGALLGTAASLMTHHQNAEAAATETNELLGRIARSGTASAK